jgi:hypothetical protein
LRRCLLQKPSEKLRRIILLLLTWGVLLGFFIAYENYYVDGQKQYLIDRDFRTLNRLSAQLNAQFKRAHLSVRSLARLMKSAGDTSEYPCQDTEASGNCFEAMAYSKTYLEGSWNERPPTRRFLDCLGAHAENVRLQWLDTSAQLVVSVPCPPLGKPEANGNSKPTEYFLQMDMKQWVHNAFQEYKNSFDDILVADETGQVLFQQSEDGPRIANLRLILSQGADISAKQNVFGFFGGGTQPSPGTSTTDSSSSGSSASGSDTKGPAKKPGAGKLERLSHGSSATRVAIGGTNYLLYAQPSPVAMGDGFDEGSHWALVLVGLRLVSKVDADSHALPYSVLIWVALSAFILLGSSWPWFKLQYMSNTERFRPRDGILLGFTLLLVSAGVMLMLLYASFLERSTARTDQALKIVAERIKTNFASEQKSAFAQLRQLQETRPFRKAFETGPKLAGDFQVQDEPNISYPYFEIVFWADCYGHQVAKLDVRKVATPLIDVNRFAFYKAVKSEMEWAESLEERKRNACPLFPAGRDLSRSSYFQPVLSPNTNEFAPVLAAPFDRKVKIIGTEQIAVQALVFRPMSLIDPVLPPGYGFAVINEKCDVLFDSETFRDMRENFCEESKDNSELHPWLTSATDTPLNISYGGKTERAYLTNFPLPGLSADQTTYLLVFQESDRQLTLDLSVILVCSIFLASYFFLLAIAALFYLQFRATLHWDYAPRMVWPCRDFSMRYLQVFGANVILSLLYVACYHGLRETPLIGTTLGAAFLSTLFAIICLNCSSAILFRFGKILCVFSVLAALLVGFGRLWLLRPAMNAPSTSEPLAGWITLAIFPLAIGVYAILVSGRLAPFTHNLALHQYRRELRRWTQNFSNPLYALATASLIVSISVVPCAGFFKYAYDAVGVLSLKHDEAVLGENLVLRKNRIANYYKLLQAGGIAKTRLAMDLDRYDKLVEKINDQNNLFFETTNEPSIEAEPAMNPCPPELKRNRPDLSLDDRIERLAARAALTFPSNELGSEIRGLGTTQTDECKSWERFWLEPTAVTFTLKWRDDSRAPKFTVWGQYQEWRGLQLWAWLTLLLFLGALVVWLLRLTKEIFLTNVERATNLEPVHWRKVADVRRHSLVIGLPRSAKTAQLRNLEEDSRNRLEFRDLRNLGTGNQAWEVQDVGSAPGVIVMDHFDFNMRDSVWNQTRLLLLEKLLDRPEQRLVLVSTVDLLFFLVEERQSVLADAKDSQTESLLLERWAHALDKFSKVKLPNTDEDAFAQAVDKFFCDWETRVPSDHEDRGFAQVAGRICLECASTPMLRTVGKELLLKFQPPSGPPNVSSTPCLTFPSREQLVEMVLDRADAYYRLLWAGLTTTERLVLYQLALDGWANPKNAPAIRQLEQKQLIYRRPMYRLINDSFRKFIRSPEHEKEIAAWQKEEQQSTWQVLRFVMVAAIIGVGAWLLYAQASLFQIGAGYITALATLLTAIAGFTARLRNSTPRPSDDAASDS